MSVKNIAEKLVGYCNAGTPERAVSELYAENIVSIEPPADSNADQAGAVVEGLSALLEKHAWWEANFEVHSSVAEGPYLGHSEHQFVVKFVLDATPLGGERQHMEEVGVYTIENDKVVREEFMYLS